jgi:hypothetical protein
MDTKLFEHVFAPPSSYLPVRPRCGNHEDFECEKVCGDVTIKLELGTCVASWFNAGTGEIIPLALANGPVWNLPKNSGSTERKVP